MPTPVALATSFLDNGCLAYSEILFSACPLPVGALPAAPKDVWATGQSPQLKGITVLSGLRTRQHWNLHPTSVIWNRLTGIVQMPPHRIDA